MFDLPALNPQLVVVLKVGIFALGFVHFGRLLVDMTALLARHIGHELISFLGSLLNLWEAIKEIGHGIVALRKSPTLPPASPSPAANS